MFSSIQKIFKRIAVILGAVLLSLFLLEGGIRLFYSFKFRPKGVSHIPASKTYRIAENKNIKYELIPESKAKVDGITYKINAFGFRDKKYRVRKDQEQRIIFAGDSLTYGWCLPLEKTYHKQLEDRLKAGGYAVEVMGMGVVGYNLVQEYFLIKDHALRFSPDLVVLQIGPNDFERTVDITLHGKTNKFVLIPYHDLSIPYMLKKGGFSRFLMKSSHLFRFINLRIFWLKKKKDPDFAPKDVNLLGEEQAFHYLEKIKDLLDSQGIPLAVVIFPYRKIEPSYIYAGLTQKLKRFLEEKKIPFLDLYQALNGKKNQDIWIDRIHPNSKGNTIVAEKIEEFIIPLLYPK
ncbi:MAG: SGNH/GDSL hydrolase family protein [Candidatus Aminicenantes bacterium]|nr:SGNH/GDSL hydrolase family protein [Candidatus Aminicenantes bacterium]